jgi:hypothetical protein
MNFRIHLAGSYIPKMVVVPSHEVIFGDHKQLRMMVMLINTGSPVRIGAQTSFWIG